MPPASPGGPVTKIGLDASQANTEIDKLVRMLGKLHTEMKAVAVASATYNEKGKITDVVFRGMTKAGTQMDIFVEKVKGGWKVAGQVTRQSIDKIIREQDRLAAAKVKQAQEAKNFANTMTFRTKLAATGRTEIPTAATQVEQRFFINAQRDLEKFVASGAVTAKRAETILDNIKAGIKGRLKGAEEDFRVAALRMFNAAQNVRAKFDQAAAKKAAATDSQKVAGFLGSQFGTLNPAATTGSVGRIENSFNRLAATVESTSVPFTRFQDLVSKTMRGVADPTNKAERSIVRLVKSIQGEFDKATDAALKLASATARIGAASTFRSGLESRLGPGLGGLNEVDRERVQAQVARIQNLMTRQNNPLTPAGATAAVDAGLKGKTGGFSGVEEQARKSAARIRQIISGQLKDPFGIKLAIDNNIGTIRGLYSARLLTQLVQDFDAVVTKAAEFQRSIALIQTITTEADGNFSQWSQSIRKVSDELGKPIAEVAAAGYDVLSNQVTKNVEDTTRVLRTAGQFARITNSSTEDSINLLSSAINTFKLQSGDAERVASQFFTTIDLGRVKTQEMANTIGRSAVYAKTLGVSLEELQAGIITITQTGQKADSSFTLLNNVFQKLLNPTKELQELYDKLGVGTGEIFVKTYGFTGALKVLAKESEGSKAKLADFFNEIRAFGGIDALISRSAVFEGALKSLGKEAQENADKAKKAFDNLPGQRFLEEMNKVKNLFLTTFQTSALQGILKATDWMGGFANAIKLATVVSVGLGVALGGVFIVAKIDAYISKVLEVQAAMGALTGITGKMIILNKLLWGAGIFAIVAVGVVLGKLYQDYVDFYDTVMDRAEEAADKQIAEHARAESEIRKEYEATLKLEQKRTLDALATEVKAGQERVKIAEATNKAIQESTKNAFENAYGSARATLEELKSRQKDALKDAQDFRKTGKARITNERDENLFRVRLTRNDTLNQNNPNALVKNERALYRNRLKQLNTLISGAAARGDMDTAKKFLDQKDQILNEMANKTVQIRGRTYMRYNGADQQLIKNSEYRLKVEEKIAKLRETEALTLQATINTETDKVSDLEDAYKEVYAFKLEDNGKPIDANEGEALKRFDAAVARAKRLTREVQESSGRRDPTMSRDLFRRQSDLAFGRGADLRAGIVQRFRETNSVESLRKAQQVAIQRLGDEAKERFDEASKKAEEAAGTYSKSWHKSVAQFKNIDRQAILPSDPQSVLGRTRINPTNPISRMLNTEDAVRRAELEKSIQMSLRGGQFDAAIREIDELIKLFEKAGVLKKKVLGQGGKSVTVGALLGDFRRSVVETRAKGGAAYEAEQAKKAAQAQTPQNNNLLNELERSLQALGPTSEAIIAKLIADQSAYQDSIAKTLRAVDTLVGRRNTVGPTIAESAENDALHKAGKPTGYTKEDGTVVGRGINPLEKADGGYIHPGGPRGTDTIPAWLTPGEFVMPAEMTDKYKPILERMRAGYFSMGGEAYCATGGELQIGGQHVTDALTGGIYASTKKLLEKHRQKVSAGKHSAGRYKATLMDGEDFEPLAFAGGGVVDNFTAQLKALNAGFSSGSYGAGEGNTSVGDINITVQGGDSGKATVQEMGRELDRALRRKAINLRGR